FRRRLSEFGIVNGFQWLDGSFSENIELSENRTPNDLDVVTFFGLTKDIDVELIMKDFAELSDPELSKEVYLLDHYMVDFLANKILSIESTKYWFQLFSHNRNRVWKGMVKLELNTSEIDDQAYAYLDNLDNE